MSTYINPTAYLINEPVGLDKEIQAIQLRLQNIPWLQIAFGRAFKQTSIQQIIDGEKLLNVKYTYPEVYQTGGEPLNVMPNDNVKSACFFYSKDPGKAIDYNFLQNNVFTYPVSLIFWFNLREIDPQSDFRYTEKLKLDVLSVLRGITSIKIAAIYETWDYILQDFTVKGNTKEFLKPPYSGFRIDTELSYTDFNPLCY